MSSFAKPWAALCLLVVALSGCNKAPKSESVDGLPEAASGKAEAATKGTTKGIIPVRTGVTTFDGNWVMVVSIQGRDRYARLIKFNKDDAGKFQAQVLDSAEATAEVTECIVDDKAVHLKFKEQQGESDFQGTFDGIAVRGTVSWGPDPLLARLLPTDAVKLSDYVGSALPPGADVFRKAIEQMQNQPQVDVILKLAREYRTSPIAFDAAVGLLRIHQQPGGVDGKSIKFDDETLKSILVEYVDLSKVWGSRLELYADFQAAQLLIGTSRMPDDGLKYLDAAEKLITKPNVPENAIEPWKQRVEIFRETAQVQKSLIKIHSKSDEERQAAYAELQEALKNQNYNPEILLALAEYAAAREDFDNAINYYSTIAALPLLEQFILSRRAGQPAGDPKPSEVLAELWKKRHGSTDALESQLASLNQTEIEKLKAEIRKDGTAPLSADVGNHTVLVEFFTGAQMWSTVAPEIAVDVLHEVYPDSKVITLRYHQHIPGPNGLANQDSEDRMAFYEDARVPLIALDGAVVNPERIVYAGPMQHAKPVYNNLRMLVDERLKQSTDVTLQLEGKVVDGELSIQAAVSGVDEELLPALRLRLAIAEGTVDAVLPIGIRHHSMVVRELPGGAKGIAAKKGELKYSFSLPISELRQHQQEYIERFQTGKGIEIPAAAKPEIRGPLYLVGWVQNDKVDEQHPEHGRAILQSVIIPIAGAEGPATQEKAPSATEPANDSPEAKPAADPSESK